MKINQARISAISILTLLLIGVFAIPPTVATTTRIYLDPSNNIYTTGTAYVGFKFNVTVWVENSPDIGAWEVYMEFNDSILRVTRWFEPKNDPQYMFYGKTTSSVPTPSDPGYVHLAPGKGRVQIAVNLFPTPPTQPPSSGPGKLCILEFNITTVPTEPGTNQSSILRLNTPDTYLLDPDGNEVPSVIKEDGSYQITRLSRIVNPQNDTWYRLTRPIDANGTIGSIEPLIIDLTALEYPPGGSLNWTISMVDTRFGEPSLVNVTWLTPTKISLTWSIPPSSYWDSLSWRIPGSYLPPIPNPIPDCEPWFFSYSVLNITCEYTPPNASRVEDSVNAVVEYGLAGEPSIETLIYGESIVGIGDFDIAILCDQASDKYTKYALAPSIVWWNPLSRAWQAGTLIGEAINDIVASPPLNPFMDLNQSVTYMEPWSIIDRTAVDILPLPKSDFDKAMLSATERMIDVDEALEALRVTSYRERWAEKVGDEGAISLQQQMFKEFLIEYITRSQKLQNTLCTVVDELEKIGDIYISPENISDFQAELWTEGFPTIEMKVFDLFKINPYYAEEEKRVLCSYSPEKLSGNFSSIINNFADEIQDGDQKLIDKMLAPHDICITDITPSKTVIGRGYNQNITVTLLNYGKNTETTNITVYANTTAIASQNVTITNATVTAITFAWNTSGFAKGNYTLSAYAWPVPGETDTSDNMLTDGTVSVSIPGDINTDGIVDVKDVYKIALAFGTSQEGPNPPGRTYNPNYDINDDGKIDIKDYYLVCRNFGKTDP